MKCLILAAGYATRLYPLTENFPKPLLEVRGKTILDWLIDDLDGCGLINEYVVISNHKYAEHFTAWANKKEQKITVVDDGTSTNEARLGAVKDIQFAIEALKIREDALVIAGDNLLDFSLQKFVFYAKEKQTSCVLRYYEPNVEKLKKSGVLLIDGEERVLEMQEKSPSPKSNWCCPPFYYYTEKDVARVRVGIEEGCEVDAPGSYIAWLCGRAAVHAMEMPGKRYDIGNLESYQTVQREYRGIVVT